jgi:secreted trypsin-like serine protease
VPLGGYDNTKPVQDISIEETIPHPYYNITDPNFKNDIALIRLSQECDYSDFVKPICLPLTEKLRQTSLDGATLTTAGWERAEDSSKSNVKLKAGVSVVPLETCRSMYLSKELWTKQLCAGDADVNDSCIGDSGGPLMKAATVNGTQYFFVAGVLSFGPKPCGLQGKPGVFTKVS